MKEHFKVIPNDLPIDLPNVIHLNGIAGLAKGKGQVDSFNIKIESSEKKKRIGELLHNYEVLSNSYHIEDLFSFAWELGENHERIIRSKDIMSKTQILVVIGYSFPFFNRTVDKLLFQSFIESNTENDESDLKIYIQSPDANESKINFLTQRFGISHAVDIEFLSNTDQFFLPPEL